MKKKPLPRFFVPDLDASPDAATLPLDEAEHLTRVLRLGQGDEIAVFDGRGREFVARVTAASRRAVKVALVEPISPIQEFPFQFTLAQGVLKGDKMDQVVRDAVMLGASRVVPLVTAHVAVSGALTHAGKPVERWERIALASVKQSGRATLPPVERPLPFTAFLRSCDRELKLLFVEPSVAGTVSPLRSFIDKPAPSSAALIIGPEGGWSSQERDEAVAAGCIAVTLGAMTLRADAVAVAAISVVRFLWEPL